MGSFDTLFALFLSTEFGVNCLATYALVHVARARVVPMLPQSRRKWAKLGIDFLNLAVGAGFGVLMGYDPHTSTNATIGVVASLFSHQVYGMMKRHLPERFGGESEREEQG